MGEPDEAVKPSPTDAEVLDAAAAVDPQMVPPIALDKETLNEVDRRVSIYAEYYNRIDFLNAAKVRPTTPDATIIAASMMANAHMGKIR